MKNQCCKNRFIYRRSWGSVRSRIRQRFAKGNYELEPSDLRANDSWEMHHHWDKGRMREKLKLHRKRFRRLDWILSSVIGSGRGTENLERMFGFFFPRCTKCGERVWHLYIDDEMAGLCNSCARPIIEKRYQLVDEQRKLRAEKLAARLIPGVYLHLLKFESVRVKGSNGMEYVMTRYGGIYNMTLKQSYCVHPRTGWGGNCYWDRIIEMYILLTQKADFVEQKAVRHQLTQGNWLAQFPPQFDRRVVTGVIPTPRR